MGKSKHGTYGKKVYKGIYVALIFMLVSIAAIVLTAIYGMGEEFRPAAIIILMVASFFFVLSFILFVRLVRQARRIIPLR